MLFCCWFVPNFHFYRTPLPPSHYAPFILLPIMRYDIMFIFSSCCQSTSPRVRQTDPSGFKMSSWRTFTPTDIPKTHTGSNEKLEHPAKRNTKHNGHTKTEKSSAARTTNWETKNHPTNYRTLTRFGSGVSVCEGLCSRGNLRKKKLGPPKNSSPPGFHWLKWIQFWAEP